MLKTFLSLNRLPGNRNPLFAEFREAGVPTNFIIKKGGKAQIDNMVPEVKQLADWFDKYLK